MQHGTLGTSTPSSVLISENHCGICMPPMLKGQTHSTSCLRLIQTTIAGQALRKRFRASQIIRIKFSGLNRPN